MALVHRLPAADLPELQAGSAAGRVRVLPRVVLGDVLYAQEQGKAERIRKHSFKWEDTDGVRETERMIAQTRGGGRERESSPWRVLALLTCWIVSCNVA